MKLCSVKLVKRSRFFSSFTFKILVVNSICCLFKRELGVMLFIGFTYVVDISQKVSAGAHRYKWFDTRSICFIREAPSSLIQSSRRRRRSGTGTRTPPATRRGANAQLNLSTLSTHSILTIISFIDSVMVHSMWALPERGCSKQVLSSSHVLVILLVFIVHKCTSYKQCSVAFPITEFQTK